MIDITTAKQYGQKCQVLMELSGCKGTNLSHTEQPVQQTEGAREYPRNDEIK
jgi:hypothetical protein